MYIMKNLWTPCNYGHYWIDRTDNGNWLRACYYEEDAMPVKLYETEINNKYLLFGDQGE